MSRKSGQGRQSQRRPKKRNSPLRPPAQAKPKVRSLESAIEAAGESPETAEPSSAEQAVIPEEERGQELAGRQSSKGVRLQKLLADRGYGSRRRMEAWIKEGQIEVNGSIAQLGQRVTFRDTVNVKGHPLREKPRLSSTQVLMYNKPEGEICTTNDPRRRPTVFRNLPKIRGARWVAVGRLDINTSGLLLFTTNGELANRLMHPSSGIEREYRCRIFGNIDQSVIRQLLEGVKIDKHLMKFNKVQVEDIEGDKRNKWAHVTLEEGRNREVRKLWEAVGCQVSRLTRVRYDFLMLPRNLRQGKFRELTAKEIRRLVGD